ARSSVSRMKRRLSMARVSSETGRGSAVSMVRTFAIESQYRQSALRCKVKLVLRLEKAELRVFRPVLGLVKGLEPVPGLDRGDAGRDAENAHRETEETPGPSMVSGTAAMPESRRHRRSPPRRRLLQDSP